MKKKMLKCISYVASVTGLALIGFDLAAWVTSAGVYLMFLGHNMEHHS